MGFGKTRLIRFSKRELEAMEEALSSRLAGERDNDDQSDAPQKADYESAWDKVFVLLDRKARKH